MIIRCPNFFSNKLSSRKALNSGRKEKIFNYLDEENKDINDFRMNGTIRSPRLNKINNLSIMNLFHLNY